MPNHIHFMIQLHDEQKLLTYYRQQKEDDKLTFSDLVTGWNKQQSHSISKTGASVFISKQFSNLFNSYTKSFNKVYERKGSLFQRPFRRKEVASPDYYADLITYIHKNPIRHGFVTRVDEWPFSSFNSIRTTKETKLKRETVLGWFENREGFLLAHS
jgi:REP element-mobilizing transposase RayT